MTTPRSFTIGQRVDLETGSFEVVGYAHGVFRLRSEGTGEYSLLQHLELARLLLPGRTLQTSVTQTTVAEMVEAVSPERGSIGPHLLELIDGTPPNGGAIREQYALTRPMSWRLECKRRELEELGIPMSTSTLKRRLARYRRFGMAGLADGRSTRPKSPLSGTDERVWSTMKELLPTYEGRSRVTYTGIRADLRLALAERYPNPADRPALPSESTVTRLIHRLSADQNPTTSARRRETDALVPRRTFRPRLVSAPGDECQIDTTVFDAFVIMPDGAIRRPHLTILLDKDTYSIIGHSFTDGPPRGYDHALLLANALVPRKVRPWDVLYSERHLDQMPWARYLSDEQRSTFDVHKPYIFPRRIVIDNGQDFRGEPFRMACARYGITVTQTPIQSPTSKAQVERNFETIKTMFAQFIPGFSGGSVDAKGVKAKKERLLHLHELDDLFDRWVSIVWQNRRHAGLQDDDNPGVHYTPNVKYMASVELTGHFFVALEPDDFIALMPRELRGVHTDGIHFRGRVYDSPHLLSSRRLRNIDGTPTRQWVHYDPTDRNYVWVKPAGATEWITCTWTALAGLSRPMHAGRSHLAGFYSFQQPGFTNEKADEILLELRTETLHLRTEREAADRKRRLAEGRDARRRELTNGTPDETRDDGDDYFDVGIV